MAGSYHHITDEDGALKDQVGIIESLENHGDVIECIEQMYGMIWYLADRNAVANGVAHGNHFRAMQNTVKMAQYDYELGLQYSPTPRFGQVECFAWITYGDQKLLCTKNGVDNHENHVHVGTDDRGMEFTLTWTAWKEK